MSFWMAQPIHIANANGCEMQLMEKGQIEPAITFGESERSEYNTTSSNASIWWRLTSGYLLELVSRAGFTWQQQRSSMEFFHRFIVPNLGPAPTKDHSPTQWRSFMTDDFTPIEFSWGWGNADAVPDRRARFSIEPIGHDAGSEKDPFNRTPSLALAHQLKDTFQDIDLKWFDWFSERMSPEVSGDSLSLSSPMYQASPSSVFLAFELGESEPLVKAYFLPPKTSGAAYASGPSIVLDTLEAFAREDPWKPLIRLVDFLQRRGRIMQLQPFMLSIDCIAYQPRLKVYVRSQDTSLGSVINLLSLFEDPEKISNGIAELEDLWKRVFRLNLNFSHHNQLPHVVHETAGILFYFEVRPNSGKVTSKVYMPVKHYGGDDWNTAICLKDFFSSRERVQVKAIDGYLGWLKAVCTHRELDSDKGMHTYIAATIKNDSLDITSYVSPEVYSRSR